MSAGPPGDLPFAQSIEGALEARIGEHGLSEAELGSWLKRVEPCLDRLRDGYRDGAPAFLRVPEATADIASSAAALARLSAGARTIVFFGTGGSSLGGQALAQLAGWNIPGSADASQKSRPRTRIYDNLDALTLARSLAALDLASTRFVLTSKSGNTPETLVQAMAAISAVEAAGLGARTGVLFLALTEPAVAGRSNGLRALCERYAIPVLDHHAGVGGRFSVLTNVGLLPGMARGLDPLAIRRGAAIAVQQMLSAARPADVPGALAAAVAVGLMKERGTRVHVMMPYADRLGRLAHWFVQLWAESLGKAGEGSTPVACLGPLDQHSQLQLFMDGPRDHLISVLSLPTAGEGPRLDPSLAALAGLPEMAGRSAGDLVAAQAAALPVALAEAKRPVRTIALSRADETAVGALLMSLMIETVLAGWLLGIDPFDQPAVELSKRIARERLAGGAG